jgi:hypothetical protein
MDGLVNYGLVDPNLSNALSAGYRGAEQNRLKMQADTRAGQIDQMKLDDLKRNRELMLKLQSDLAAAGHDPDLNKVFDALIATGNPDYVTQGIAGKQHLKEQQAYAALIGGAGTAANAPMAAPADAPMTAPAAPMAAAPAAPIAAAPAAPIAAAPAAPIAAAPTNALVSPPAAAPVSPSAPTGINALVRPAMRDAAAAAATQKRIDDLMAFAGANPSMASIVMQQARILQDQLGLQSRNAPAKPAALEELDAYMNMTPAQKVAFERLQKIKAPGTNVNVAAPGKKFAETLGENAAKQLNDHLTHAQSAQESLATSEQLAPLLNSKDFISGTLGDARLTVAKTLGLAGAEESQAYFAGIGQQVAERIKAFGAGTGLSDSDRDYAKLIAGGKTDLTPSALKRIVQINNDSARRVINNYLERRTFLSKKEPSVLDYYPDIAVPQSGRGAAGGDPGAPASGWGEAKAK